MTRPAKKLLATALASSFAACVLSWSGAAEAQQTTFHLDRLEMPGAPDDGVAMFRPVTNQRFIAYGQLGMGYSLNVLRVRNVTRDEPTIKRSNLGVVKNQLTLYGAAGIQVFDRVTIGVAFPFTMFQSGQNPDYGSTNILTNSTNSGALVTDASPAGDTRVDLRGVVLRSADRRSALGAQLSFFAPTGSTASFGGDGGTGVMFLLAGEYGLGPVILAANTGLHFRPKNSINDARNNAGLGIGREWRYALGFFAPWSDGKYRIGATAFGQTGLQDDSDPSGGTPVIGNTYFTAQNSPLEIDGEFKMRFGTGDQWWIGGSAGTAIFRGYGAPDLRTVAFVGYYTPVFESDTRSPQVQARDKYKRDKIVDRDGDGIPDDLDACPDEPEDHLGSDPNDGCPMPKDRDGDGIPDNLDKCPDAPEDKDGIDDEDGCPEDDADKDGVLDAVDACPHDPGPPNPDKTKNGCPLVRIDGGMIRVLEQVHFQTGSAVILADSFPLLQKVADIFKSQPAIKRVSIDGHTDNRGGAGMNKTLSQNRANSVMKWLVEHGVEKERLEAHGYGLERPVQSNDTDDGRAANRRVEFKILDEKKGD